MSDIIIKAIRGDSEETARLLGDICENEHYSCNDKCPVFKLNGHKPAGHFKPFKENRGCDCFKDGRAMLNFIKNYQVATILKEASAMNFTHLKNLVVDHVKEIASGYSDERMKQYIYESAVQTVYGPEIWVFIKDNQK